MTAITPTPNVTVPSGTHQVTALPETLDWPAALPEHGQLRGRDRWMDSTLATISQPAGFDPRTGEPRAVTTDVVAAPYPEYRAVVRLPKSTPFQDVIAAAQALTVDGDRAATYGNAQAVLQSEAGNWYITMAGVADRDGHVEPLPVSWGTDATATRDQKDLVAIVGRHEWVNFSDRTL